jgi:transcriptional regulator with XRE-family HTH domain
VDTEENTLSLEKERLRWERVTAIVLTGTRRDLDVSQQELASRLGWTRNMIANLESGRRSLRLSDLFLIARALSISPDTLMLRIMRWGKS